MKIAILADVHGNRVGLQTTADHIESWQPDLTIFAGDIVNRGPYSLDCLHFVQQKQREAGWQVIRGNHEDYVIQCDDPEIPRSGLLYEIHRPSFWAYNQLNGDISALDALPTQLNLTGPDGGEIRIIHASMRANNDGIYPQTTDEVLRQQIIPAPPVFCVGHTHRPLIRHIDDTLVINVGSAGMPFDGNRQLSYAQLTWQHDAWQAEIIRLDYDRQQTERDFIESGFVEGGGPIARLMMHEWYSATPHIYKWIRKYRQPVLDGEISLEESVNKTLAAIGAI